MSASRSSFSRPAGHAISRRMMVCGVSVLIAPTLATTAAAQPSRKMSKQDAGYKDSPNGASHCAGCVQFLAPSSCKLVEGAINPAGWCTLFAARR